MKKITLLLMMLSSMLTFSQIEIVENFDTTANNQVPTGWTSSGYSNTIGNACSGSSTFDNVTAGTSGTLTSPYQASASNETDLSISFDFNVFVFLIRQVLLQQIGAV